MSDPHSTPAANAGKPAKPAKPIRYIRSPLILPVNGVRKSVARFTISGRGPIPPLLSTTT